MVETSLVSGAELEKALGNGVPGPQILFNGPGKTRADLLRAAQSQAQQQPVLLRNGDLEIQPGKRSVRYRGELIDFTALEFDLLLHFAQSPGRPVPGARGGHVRRHT